MSLSTTSPSSGEASQPSPQPEPFIIPPSATHTHTIILLHGRGSNGPKVGAEFLASTSSTGRTLAQTFPGVKFVFPTATKRRAVQFKRMRINQWFDMYGDDQWGYREYLAVDGLQDTTALIHRLVEVEVETGIPRGRIILGGLSQGCAASLYAMVCGELVGGYIGMSGWLPFAEQLEGILDGDTGEDDIFAPSSDAVGEDNGQANGESASDEETLLMEAVGFLRENISLAKIGFGDWSPVQRIPVFLGHGALDEKVPCGLGEQASYALQALGFQVTWRRYEQLGHWYAVPDEIDDIITFLAGIGVESTS
ncbi:hypothetical protein TWF696_004891 [Orbilia brochopaga]|uniref:Phospholipase/carboxylesterase/thioesterase domain-containing protein n=1 Tax=Orbilia brochopaga TaxID=3140254 RepID=A0AAV9UZZ5_9PEZI